MNKSYRKNILRTIQKSISRFAAIFAIVALGVGFLAGLLVTTPDMRYSGDVYFDDTRLFDVRIISTLGLTGEDVSELEKIDGIETIMPSYYADMFVKRTGEGDTQVTRIHSLPNDALNGKTDGYLNQMEIYEGRMPKASNECVVEVGSDFVDNPVVIGDELIITDENKKPKDTFEVLKFKVVGIVKSSYYFSYEREPASIGNGSLGLIMHTPTASFAKDIPYTNIFITLKNTQQMNSLSDEYADFVDDKIKQIEQISDAQCKIRLDSVKEDANKEINDAKKEYNEAKQEAEDKLADALKTLQEGRRKFEDGKIKLADGRQKIADGETQFAQGRAELEKQKKAGSEQLANAENTLKKAREEFKAGENEYNTNKSKYDIGVTELEKGKAFLQQYEPLVTRAEAYFERLGLDTQEKINSEINSAKNDLDTKSASYENKLNDQTLPANQKSYLLAQYTLDVKMISAGYATLQDWQIKDAEQAKIYIDALEAEKLKLDSTLISSADAVIAMEKADFVSSGGKYIALNGAKKLADLRPEIDKITQQIAVSEPILQASKLQLDTALVQINSARQKLEQGELEFKKAKEMFYNGIADGTAQLDGAKKALEDARVEYDKGVIELQDASAELADGEKEYADAKTETDEKLSDAKIKIDDAEKEIAKIKSPEWFVLDRGSNVSFASFSANTEKVEAIAKVFPIFFFLVAALVALTTMTRMVEEERLQIGTMKALGYRRKVIMAKYVIYALAASVSGSVFGLLVGFNLFPRIIWNAYTMMYTLPKIYCQFNWTFAIISSGAAIGCTLLATLNACWGPLMHETPAQLMLPRAPKAGKRIFLEYIKPLWKKMKFTHKVTARNLLLYKKRFFMTITGIAGCTALLVTGFGLHDAISDIVNKQFGDIFLYDFSVSVKNEKDIKNQDIQNILNDSSLINNHMPIHQEKSSNTFKSDTFSTYIFVPQQNDRLKDFVKLQNRKTGEDINFEPEKGIIITEKISERSGCSVGDRIVLKNNDEVKGEFLVTGVSENYVENYVYISEELYRQQFGYSPKYTSILAKLNKTENEQARIKQRDTLSENMLDMDSVANLYFNQDTKASFNEMLKKIDTIVVVLIVCAALLAFVVLYNLTNINITEREKEIATIKVLGYFDREVASYIFRESAVLSILGALAGLLLGILLHSFIIYTIEVDNMMFGRDIKMLSYLYSFVLTLVFSAVVNIAMQFKLKRINMVSSMKAPE